MLCYLLGKINEHVKTYEFDEVFLVTKQLKLQNI